MGSVGGLFVMLNEPALRTHTLDTINKLNSMHWVEIFTNREVIEDIANDAEAPDEQKHLACAICSKCYYFMEDYSSALLFALRSGSLLQQDTSEYHTTIISKALDTYIQLAQGDLSPELDLFAQNSDFRTKLGAVVDNLFTSCVERGSYKEAIGIAFEARSVEKIKYVLDNAGQQAVPLSHYCFDEILTKRFSVAFKIDIIKNLTEFFEKDQNSSFTSLFAALHELRDVAGFAELLDKLFSSSPEEALIALQAAFDILGLGDTAFIKAVSDSLGDVTNLLTKVLREDLHQKALGLFLNLNCKTDLVLFRKLKDASNKSVLRNSALTAYAFMQSGTGINTFLTRNEGRNFLKPSSNWSRFSGAAVYGAVYKGTGDTKKVQTFLPQADLSVISTAGPFSDGGGLYALGLIHAKSGMSKHLDYLMTVLSEGMNIRQAEPQQDGTSGFQLKKWEPLIHGACLGVGLIAFGRGHNLSFARIQLQDYLTSIENDTRLQIPAERLENVSEKLLSCLDMDEAVASEAAAWALAMIGFGIEKETIQPDGSLPMPSQERLLNMLNIAKEETAHERVIRACSLHIACSLFGAGDTSTVNSQPVAGSVDSFLAAMQGDTDAIIRYGGMFAYGMAYVGTSDRDSIRNLLQVAVSDVNNDVRRAAVINLGLICLDQPEEIPELISLLSESYNPHVRYGSAIALGIAGTSIVEDQPEFKKLFDTLMALCEDPVDFVRQGAFIALGMSLAQSNWDIEGSFAQKYKSKATETYSNVKTSAMSRFGAMIGMGLLEAGGRNAAVSLFDKRYKKVKADAVAGLVMFLQYWYWYPLMHLLTLSLSPSALIGVSISEGMKQVIFQKSGFDVACDVDNTKLKEFAYPAKIKNKKAEQRAKIEIAVLSMAKGKGVPAPVQNMDVEEEKSPENTGPEETAALSEEERKDLLKAPLRVTKLQEKFIAFKNDGETIFLPVAPDNLHRKGVVVLAQKEGTTLPPIEEQEILLDLMTVPNEPAQTDNVGPVGDTPIIEEA